MTAPQLGTVLRATCSAIRKLVAELHSGNILSALSADRALRSRSVCWTPSFVPGAPTSEDSKPYNTLLLSKMFGNDRDNRAHPIVRLALTILELQEVGAMDQKDAEDIFEGTDNLTRALLEKILRRTHAVYTEQIVQQEAIAILAASKKSRRRNSFAYNQRVHPCIPIGYPMRQRTGVPTGERIEDCTATSAPVQ